MKVNKTHPYQDPIPGHIRFSPNLTCPECFGLSYCDEYNLCTSPIRTCIYVDTNPYHRYPCFVGVDDNSSHPYPPYTLSVYNTSYRLKRGLRAWVRVSTYYSLYSNSILL